MLKFVILFTFLFSVSDVNAQMLFDGSQNTNPPKASSVVMPKKEVKKQIAEEENGILQKRINITRKTDKNFFIVYSFNKN